MGRAHKKFPLHQIIGRKQLCCLRAKTMFGKQAIALKSGIVKIMCRHCVAMTAQIIGSIFSMLLSHWLSPLCSSRQTASRLAIKICDSIKYLWALPTPTTFEKVDQTFYFGTESLAFALLCCPTEA